MNVSLVTYNTLIIDVIRTRNKLRLFASQGEKFIILFSSTYH